MANVQWIRITTDMFDNKKIKYLRSLPEGNNIVLIWVMLLTEAGRCNSNGFIFLTERIPFTPTLLANELGFHENVVTIALKALEALNMIHRDNEQIVISNWEEYQNIDGLDKIREQTKKRVQKHRENAKALVDKKKENSCSVTCNVTVTDSNATEKNRKDKELELNKKTYMCDFETLWSHYPRKKEKAKANKCYQARIKEGYSPQQMLDAVITYAEECKRGKVDEKFIKLCATFLGPNIPFTDYIRKEDHTDGRTTKNIGANDEHDAIDQYLNGEI